MKRTLVALVAAATTAGGLAFGLGGGVASAHRTTVICASAGSWTIVNSEPIPMTFTTDQGHSGSIGPSGQVDHIEYSGTSLTVFGTWENGATATNTGEGDCELPVDVCDTSAVVGSVARWLASNDRASGGECFEITSSVECGSFDAQVTTQPSPGYANPFLFVWNEGVSIDLDNATATPATFAEDYNGGSVEVTYYIVGPEQDWVVGSGLPNFWDGNAETVTVDTDCEDDTTETTAPPTTAAPTTTTAPTATAPPSTLPPVTQPPVTTPDITCDDLWTFAGTDWVFAGTDNLAPGEYVVGAWFDALPNDPLDADNDGKACEREFPFTVPAQPDWMNAELPQTR